MASSNYFNYGGTQYANAGNAATYQQTQQGYGVPPNATGNISNTAATTAYPSQRNAFEAAAAAAAYQTSAAPVTYAPAAVGVTYDSSKTYYPQASPAAVAAAAASSGQGSVAVASSADFQNWQQANYGARQSTVGAVAAANKVAYNATNYSAIPPATRQLTASSIGAKSQSGANASSLYSPGYSGNAPSSAQNAAYHYSNPPSTASAKAVTVGAIGQQLAKKTPTAYQSNPQPSTGNSTASGHGTGGNYNAAVAAAVAGNAHSSVYSTNAYSSSNTTGSLYNNASSTTGRIKTNQQSGVPSGANSGGPYANPYDAALFNAAATMYMNQNPRASGKTGGANFGSSAGATAAATNFKPRPGFRNAKFRSMRPPKPQQLHYCDACKISCAGPSAYHDHLQGQKHKKKVAKTNAEQTKGKTTTGGNLPIFVCELCDIECTAADAYAAHLRGAKHTKVVKLHTRLGKPIPPPDPKAAAAVVTMIAQEDGKPKGGNAPTMVARPSNASVVSSSNARSSITPRITFVAAGTLSNTPLSSSSSSNTAAASSSNNGTIPEIIGPPKKGPVVEPKTEELSSNEDVNKENDLTLIDDRPAVGSEYIEEEKDSSGKLISFNCKLCECKFSDPNAKEMHMKGRKHRLQFKRKVDPKLKVEMKPNSFKNKKNEKWKKTDDKASKDAIKRKEFRFEDEGNHPEWGRKMGIGPSFGMAGGLPPQAIRHPLMRTTPRPLLMGGGARLGTPANQLLQPHMFMMGASPLQTFSRKLDTYEDRHVQSRFKAIYPSENKLKNIDKMLGYIEKALKLVSDQLLTDAEAKEEKESTEVQPTTEAIENDDNNAEGDKMTCSTNDNGKDLKEEARCPVRELTGVLRIGIIAKDLVSVGDNEMELVMLCSGKPTVSLLDRVVAVLPEKLQEVCNEVDYSVTAKPLDAAIVIVSTPKDDEKPLTIKVTLTSTIIREEIMAVSESNRNAKEEGADTTDEAATANDTAVDDGGKVSKDISPDPPDVLSKTKCLEALAALRHAKWFQMRAALVPSCSIVIRILRDICERVNAWAPLNSWAMELLCERVLTSCNMALSPGDGLRRVFESVAAGILLPDGPGLCDPCEKDPVDAAAYLTSQQREDITAYAQHALRLIAFRQIHKVLGMDPLPAMVSKFRNKPANRKRRRENSTGGRNDGVDGKKDKKEEEEGGAGGGAAAGEENGAVPDEKPPIKDEERMETDKPTVAAK